MVAEYLTELRSLGYSPTTIKSTKQVLDRFHSNYGGDSRSLGDAEVFDFLVAAGDQYSRHTFARYKYVLRGYFEWLEGQGRILVAPKLLGRLVNPKGDKKLTVMSERQIGDLVGHPLVQRSLKLKALIQLMYSAGLRRAEVANLKISDIDFRGSLFVEHGKGGKDRIVPVPASSLKVLREYLSLRKRTPKGGSEHVFLNHNHQRKISENSIGSTIYNLSQAIGVHFTCHVFRRSIATHMHQRGMSVRDVADFLGHESLEVTQRYIITQNCTHFPVAM